MINERGILFSSEMVRALLAGTKTITRRIVNEKKLSVSLGGPVSNEAAILDIPELAMTAPKGIHAAHMNPHGAVTITKTNFGLKPGEFHFRCPYADGVTRLVDFPATNGGRPRKCWTIRPFAHQRLWVRETWRGRKGAVRYRADGELPRGKWRPSIYLPRKFARIVLTVEEVRIERLHDIDDADAKREGVRPFFEEYPHIGRDQRLTTGELACDQPYRASFAALWDDINGAKALWKNSNPFVWVVSFAVLERP